MSYRPWILDFCRRDSLDGFWSQTRFATASEAYAFAAAHVGGNELRLWLERPGDLCPVPLYRVDDYDVATLDYDGDEEPPEAFRLRELEFPDEETRAECYADLRHTGVHFCGGGASSRVRVTLQNPRIAG